MEVWPTFDADRLEAAIDPEVTIHHSGMPAPIRGAEEPDYVRGIKALMPDVRLQVANWAATNDDVVFIEDEISGTLAGQSLGLDRHRPLQTPGATAQSTPSGAGTTSTSSPRSTPPSVPPAFAETAAQLVSASAPQTAEHLRSRPSERPTNSYRHKHLST